MSSLARRGLRATAAVAGIAVAGVGLASPVFAAPAPADPERPTTDETAQAPENRSTPQVVGEAPSGPQLPDLPQLFTIRDTGVHTADRGAPQLPTADALPTDRLPSPGETVNLGETQESRNTDVKVRTATPEQGESAPQQRDGAMQQLDAASMFDDLPGKVMGATANNDVRS
ncbi:hypothetical protein [Pseudonocardia zijingensis]|uniref:Uncharacterized protein n=1 Tax=Pseudonocardia zijingensis TaxID=153376 RepID=A0ABP4A3G6_9PSEU